MAPAVAGAVILARCLGGGAARPQRGLLMDMTGPRPVRRWLPVTTYDIEMRIRRYRAPGAIPARLYRARSSAADARGTGVHGGGADEPRLVSLSNGWRGRRPHSAFQFRWSCAIS
jgi:hypothetical protein